MCNELIRKFKNLSKIIKAYNIISTILATFMSIVVILTVIEELSLSTNSVTIIGSIISCAVVFLKVIYFIYRLWHFKKLNQDLIYAIEDESITNLKELYKNGLSTYDKFISIDIVIIIMSLFLTPINIVTNLCIIVNIYQTIRLNKMSLSIREYVTEMMAN